MTAVNGLAAVLCGLPMLLLVQASLREGERRAATLGLVGFLGNLAVWGGLWWFSAVPAVRALNWILLGAGIAAAFLVLIPWFPCREGEESRNGEAQRVDERDHMFSRNELQNHPRLAAAYYAAHPDFREEDAALHAAPELGEPGGRFFDGRCSPMASAAFSMLARWRSVLSQTITAERHTKECDGRDLADHIRALGRYYGAVDVGFADLRSHFWYSHRGRHADHWGQPVRAVHRRAVVIVVAMQPRHIRRAPALPVLLESARQYVESAKIAAVIAEYLAARGHDARAHTDGNYELLCVPVAVAAGLGELGRMGIFMHHAHGPCVRLALVTTNAPLPPGRPSSRHMAEFCRICRKCADNCPSRAIPSGDEPVSRGFPHWSIHQERCYAFWKRAGTDCAFCIRVCPFSKPDTLVHRMVRRLIARNPWNQRLALFLDDLLYRRRPPHPRENPRPLLPGLPAGPSQQL